MMGSAPCVQRLKSTETDPEKPRYHDMNNIYMQWHYLVQFRIIWLILFNFFVLFFTIWSFFHNLIRKNFKYKVKRGFDALLINLFV